MGTKLAAICLQSDDGDNEFFQGTNEDGEILVMSEDEAETQEEQNNVTTEPLDVEPEVDLGEDAPLDDVGGDEDGEVAETKEETNVEEVKEELDDAEMTVQALIDVMNRVEYQGGITVNERTDLMSIAPSLSLQSANQFTIVPTSLCLQDTKAGVFSKIVKTLGTIVGRSIQYMLYVTLVIAGLSRANKDKFLGMKPWEAIKAYPSYFMKALTDLGGRIKGLMGKKKEDAAVVKEQAATVEKAVAAVKQIEPEKAAEIEASAKEKIANGQEEELDQYEKAMAVAKGLSIRGLKLTVSQKRGLIALAWQGKKLPFFPYDRAAIMEAVGSNINSIGFSADFSSCTVQATDGLVKNNASVVKYYKERIDDFLGVVGTFTNDVKTKSRYTTKDNKTTIDLTHFRSEFAAYHEKYMGNNKSAAADKFEKLNATYWSKEFEERNASDLDDAMSWAKHVSFDFVKLKNGLSLPACENPYLDVCISSHMAKEDLLKNIAGDMKELSNIMLEFDKAEWANDVEPEEYKKVVSELRKDLDAFVRTFNGFNSTSMALDIMYSKNESGVAALFSNLVRKNKKKK